MKKKKKNTAIQKSAKQPNEQPDTTDMPDLESKVSRAQRKNQQEKGVKILAPSQMLSRLPITFSSVKRRK